MTPSDGIAFETTDDVARIILQAPERGNTLTRAMTKAFALAVDAVLNARPRAILLMAEGRMFCAGGDIDEFIAGADDLGALVDATVAPLHPAMLRLHESPVPVVSAVNGPIGGAGVGLALCADFVLAATSMKLRTGYAAIGLSPDAGTAFYLARRVGPVRAQQWLMLSDAIDAQTCLQHGAVDALHADDALRDAAEALAARLARGAPGSLAAIKTLCAGLPGRALADHLDLEHRLLVERAGSAAAREGIRAFIEKRAPRFSGDV
ncbi:MAG: enoyl-CoA hydratase-related protein [Burkholderiaceae bacterium]|nr:enoyl-CoA hydratase-related protein [Burkholderiaceae bacterium]